MKKLRSSVYYFLLFFPFLNKKKRLLDLLCAVLNESFEGLYVSGSIIGGGVCTPFLEQNQRWVGAYLMLFAQLLLCSAVNLCVYVEVYVEVCVCGGVYVEVCVCGGVCMWRCVYVEVCVCGGVCMWRCVYVEVCMWRCEAIRNEYNGCLQMKAKVLNKNVNVLIGL